MYLRALRVFLLLLFVLPLFGARRWIPRIPAVGGGPTYLIKQDFEGAGYDNGETWTEAGSGTKDEDYTTIVLDGSQSLNIAGSSQNPSTVSPTFAAQSDVWIYFQFQIAALPAAQRGLLAIRNGSTTLCTLLITTSGQLRITDGTGSNNTSAGMSAATKYHIWVRRQQGTTASAAFSTNGVRPTSGTSFISVTPSTSGNADNISVGMTGTGAYDAVFDHIRVDDVTIGDNPS